MVTRVGDTMISPQTRFHSVVVAITVFVMFAGVTGAAAFLQNLTFRSTTIGGFVAALSSVGVYRLLALGLIWLMEHSDGMMKFVLGPYFVKGTWIGRVRTKTGKPRLIVEKMEQTLYHVTVFGWSFTPDGIEDANWKTESAQINAVAGELFCFYLINVPYKHNPVEALGRLQFDRPSERKGPKRMTGYTVDTDATSKLRYDDLRKLSDKLLDVPTALGKAKHEFASFMVEPTSESLAISGTQQDAPRDGP